MRAKKTTKNNQRGFTLVEMLVTIFIFTLLMGGVTIMFKDIFFTSTQQSLTLNSVDQARLALSNFDNEIRNAANGNDGSYPLNQATSTQIIFFSTFGATSTKVDRIRYYVATSTLYKGVIVPSGNPLGYTSGEVVTTVLSEISNATNTPIFTYYDGNYAGTSSPLSQPVNLNQVKLIKITLTLTEQDVRNSTSTFSLTSAATMRNLKNNLGN